MQVQAPVAWHVTDRDDQGVSLCPALMMVGVHIIGFDLFG
ncbi:hypothetical protein GXY_07480 [Novacetimonas hansenii ATCC 23769]|uniref:Uncharacterized protein n=1 Tax=Novacetimonas hansenii ATCC 23769 TaxID=714995 RepID=D5QED1_NOVHA|nr:hypothetical protein GXY_07480 [Novacetimonas hansenii ATCC 23769]